MRRVSFCGKNDEGFSYANIFNAVTKHDLQDGVTFHNDCGSQYISKAYRELLKTYKVMRSFLMMGTLGDNAWSESVVGIFKEKRVALHTPTAKEAIHIIIFYYIEYCYSRIRVQKLLSYMSSAQFTKMLMEA